ncbi:MAG: PQQ-like beta-propeller repeat protein [Planctomycetia bacterium]|nr:PQQ-like beta-propeller repeat protein [Planctomycetia bacterium]
MQTNDSELIALLESKAPEQLTLEEIERVNARLPHSTELQQFLVEQIQMEQYLATALSRVEVRVDEIISGKRRNTRTTSPWRYRLAIALSLGGVIGLGGIWLVSTRWKTPPAPTTDRRTETPEDGKRLAKPSHPSTKPDSSAGGLTTPADAGHNDTTAQNNSSGGTTTGGAAGTMDTAPTSNPPAAKQPVAPPWESVDQLGGGRRPWAALALADPPSRGLALAGDEQARWFRAAGPWLELKAPWPDDAMLRLRVSLTTQMEIRFWDGTHGAAFQLHGHQGWTSYRLERAANQTEPNVRELWETDDGLYWKFHSVDVTWRKKKGRFNVERQVLPNDTPIDFVYQDGAIQLWRGDLRLASAPLPGLPAQVQLKLDGQLQHVSMAHTDQARPQPRYESDSVLSVQPGQLPWIRQVPAPATMDAPDGAARLTVPAGGPAALAAVKLEQLGLGEVQFRVAAASSGTAVFLGGPDGKPVAGVQFVHQTAGGPDVVFSAPWEAGAPALPDATALAIRPPGDLWVRLLIGSGSLRAWQSRDGKCWAYVGAKPLPAGAAPIASWGIYAAGGPTAPRSITLRSVKLREMTGLNSLATAELIRAAPANPAATPETWKQATAQGQPAGVDPGLWHRAAALRTIACGAGEPVSSWLLRALLQDAARLPRKLQQNAKLLAEFPDVAQMAWIEPWNGRPSQPTTADLIAAAEDFADSAAAEEELRPFMTLGREILRGRRGTFAALNDPFPTNLVVPEIMHLAAAERFDELEETGRTARLYGRDEVAGVTRWAIDQVAQRRRGEAGSLPQPSDGKSVELAIDTTKAQRMFIADLMDAVRAKRWDQACDLITHVEPAGRLEMFADPADPLVWVPPSTEMAALMAENPRLADRMRLKFAERGKLRVRFAIAENDVAGVSHAATQFAGTPAAAEGWQWIGDQLLRGGDAAGALAWYHKAEPLADLALAEPLAARLRLASAMLGRDVGRPRQSPVRFDGQEYDAAQFEALVRKARAEAHPAGSSTSIHVPPPSGYRIEELAIAAPDRPWQATGLTLALAGETLLAQDSRTVAAGNLATGQPVWNRPLGQDNSNLAWVPQVQATTALFSSVNADGAHFSRLDLKSGEVLNQSQPIPGPCFAGYAPMVAGQTAIAFGSRTTGKHSMLCLAAVDLGSGRILRETPLVPPPAARNAVGHCPPLCTADAALVFVDGGIVCCETAGVIRWIRREHWLGQSAEAADGGPVPTCAIAIDGDAIVWQPHVPYIERIDLARGHRKWLRMLPNTRRLVGQIEQRLIVETENRLVALDVNTGRVLWARPLDGLLAPVGIGPPGGILLVREKTVRAADPNRAGSLPVVCPELVWLNPGDGRMTAVQPLEQLAAEKIALGPWVFYQDSIVTFFGSGQTTEKGVRWEPNRRLLRLTPQGGAQPPREAAAPSLWEAGQK